MELRLTGTDINHFALVQENVCGREETLETIVPDARPDIAQIVDTCGFCCLTRREITDSGVLLAGSVRVSVLYIPEGGGGLQRMEAEMPFQHLHDCQQTENNGRLLASGWVAGAETRIINPRKVLIRVELKERIQLYSPQALGVCSGIEGEKELGLQQRSEHYQAALLLGPAEKVFTLEEDVDWSGGKNRSGTILRICPRAQCDEVRLIGSKLVLKGSVTLKMLCQGEEGELFSSTAELPLSQMMDAQDVSPEAIIQAELCILDWSVGEQVADGRTVPVTLELAAHAVCCETVPVAILTDAYSIYYPMKQGREEIRLQQMTELTKRQPIREFLESESGIHTICACHEELGAVQIAAQGDQATIRVPVESTVLFLCEDGSCGSLRHHFTVEVQQTLPEGSTLRCIPRLEELDALPAATGVELRGALSLYMQIWESYQVTELTDAELDREHPIDCTQQPSAVLRRPSPGEELWDIAKRYSTTCQEICIANGLTEDQELGTQMLLIPRKR